MPGRATLRDVARRAGVSAGMAGRVLGNYGSFSESTRRKVLSAAKAVEYTPNIIARSLRTRLTKTIGVLISDITTFFWTTLTRGIQDRAAKENFSIILCNSDEESHSEKAFLTTLIERNIDGLIISPTLDNHSYLRKLSRSLIPLVLVDRKIKGLHVPTIRVDNQTGAYDAVRHLIGLGHERIAIIKGIDGVETSDERYAGYAKALNESGIPIRVSLVKEGRFLKDRAFAVTKELIRMKRGPSAIFVCNEPMVSGSMIALKESGVRIPEDIALIGFDDPVWAAYTDPPLTTVSQPSYAMGMLAFDYLLAQIMKPDKNDKYVEDVVLKPTLIVRKSCSAVPRGGDE
jgi:LacI family transcriptional regulator